VPRSAPRARRDVLVGQIALLLFLAVAIALFPGLVLKWNQAGLSNYGVRAKTVVPYSLALGLCAGFSLAAARALPGRDATTTALRRLLTAYAALMGLSLLSTYVYKMSAPLHDVHVALNVATALFETAVAIWLVVRLRAGVVDTVSLGVQLAGFVCAVVDYVGLAHILFTAQALSLVGFGVLLVRAVWRVARNDADALTPT
jgi:hypothetical protein